VFAPMYAHALSGFAGLITQLLHESSCKFGRGQTILTATGRNASTTPTSACSAAQEHGGGVLTVDKPQAAGMKTSDGVPLEKALQFEYEGTRDDAAGMAYRIHVRLSELSPKEVGALLAFSHYAFGVYPALLRTSTPSTSHRSRRARRYHGGCGQSI